MAIRAAGDRIKEVIRTGRAELLHLVADDLKSSIGPEGFNPLHWACHYGQVKVLQKIIASGADVSSATKCGWSGLHISAIRGQTECLQVLLDAGADPAQPDRRGYTPTHLSAAHGTATILQILLRTGLDPNVRDTRGWTPANHAAFHGRLGALQVLIHEGADMMLKDHKGCMPAHHAAMEGHTDCLKLLATNTTDLIGLLHAKNNDGLTPLTCALQYHKTHSVEYLRSVEQEITSTKTEYPAHVMCCRGDLTRMKSLIDQGTVSLNGRDELGDTLAHKAAIHGQLECLMWLIKTGADVSLVNNLGETPYDLAVQYRRRACSALLARSMRHVYPPFWYTPTWKHYQHTTENPLWGTEGHFWGSEDTPFSFWGTKGCYKTAPEMCSYNLLRSARDHYRDPDDVMWVKLETEAREEEQKRCVSELKASLHYERQRRELLEGELDATRRQLQCATIRIMHLSTASPQNRSDSAQTTIKK